MINVKSILVTALIMMGVTFSNVTLTLTNLDAEAGTVDVYMVNDTAVGGFQFGLSGVTMTGGSGGTSADAGFTVSASASTLLAFSFTGATIPAGEGVLVSVSFDNPDGAVESCIQESVFSDSVGGALEFTEGCITLIEGGGCTDEAACNFDADATVDDGSCFYAEPLEDCLGNFIGAKVQIIHASPSPTVDVYVDGELAIANFEYESATPVLQLPTTFTVGIAAAGDETILAEFPFELEVDGSYVVVATGILGDEVAPFGLAADATTFGASFSDQVGLHVYHGSTDAPAVDVLADGGVLIENLAYGDFSGYVEVPAADYTIGVAPTGGASIADFTAPLSGLGGGTAVVFASGFLSGADDLPGFGLFAALQDGTVLELPAILPAEVSLQITNVTSDNVEVSVDLDAELGGFQFTLASSCDATSWTGGSGGLAADAGFNVSVGATGVALGFSLTGATIPEGSGGVLVNVGTSFDCPEATFSVVAGTFSSPAGTALTYDLGTSFEYPGVSDCPEGEIVGCDGECHLLGMEPVLDECGQCWTPYCYFGLGDFQYIPSDECLELGGAWIGPGNPADPLWNAAMDCAGVCDGDAVEDCAGDCGGTAEVDACGECGGEATDPSACLENFVVDLEWTGVSQLTIFQASITTLEVGDEIGIFDNNAMLSSGDCSGTTGAALVGAGIWSGEQLEVVSIGSVDNCAFGGFQLPGYQEGNDLTIKVYRDGTEYSATATYAAGTGTFGDLFMAISELDLEEPNPPFYNVELNGTGVNQLIIFTDSITGLESGDEIGIFDAQAITNSGDCSSTLGELLVGTGVWGGEQLEVVSIGSVDNCAFGGSQLPGWVSGSSVMIKVYRPSTGLEYAANATYSAGTGTFGDLFMAVSEVDLGSVLSNDDVWFGPDSYTLNQNYPNPFNPITDISFEAGISGEVSLVIYDILGNKVKTLVNGFVTPGNYVVSWDGTDNTGNNVSSGVYVYTLITSGEAISRKMLLVK